MTTSTRQRAMPARDPRPTLEQGGSLIQVVCALAASVLVGALVALLLFLLTAHAR